MLAFGGREGKVAMFECCCKGHAVLGGEGLQLLGQSQQIVTDLRREGTECTCTYIIT